MEVLMLSPEPPYPLNGGGAFRTASLLHYFARFASVDLILISQRGTPALLPPGLVRSQTVIPLAEHSSGTAARYIRNAGRAIRGVPPLIDRLSGLDRAIEHAFGGRRYDFCVVEHFWCAPYLPVLAKSCTKLLLDLHNVESSLHKSCASLSNKKRNGVLNALGEQLIRAGHHRFAAASENLEAALLPLYSEVLVTSEDDARLARAIAPAARVHVYPNALPWSEVPELPESNCLVFSANFEYHPNIDAVQFFVNEIWPITKRSHPGLRLRLVGRGDAFIRHLLPPGPPEQTGIEVTGQVEDARAEIAQARIVIAPLRAGSGTRIKILEAWAAARCVVATPLAAEGLEAKDGVNIALAAPPQDFAARLDALLCDPETRQRLASGGRRTYEHSYCWEIVWRNLDIDLQLTHEAGLNGYTGNF
jgi:glycosyltransferase involved in cell wall biosynthesis